MNLMHSPPFKHPPGERAQSSNSHASPVCVSGQTHTPPSHEPAPQPEKGHALVEGGLDAVAAAAVVVVVVVAVVAVVVVVVVTDDVPAERTDELFLGNKVQISVSNSDRASSASPSSSNASNLG